MFSQFDRSIQVFPGLVAEHIMLSLAEGERMGELDFSKRIIFSPSDVSIFSLSVLGSLYYRLSLRPNTRRIIYLWSDENLHPDTIHIPESKGMSQVLGKKIIYTTSGVDGFFDKELVRGDLYFMKNDFRYTHAHHISFLEKIEVLPIVFAETKDLSRYIQHILPLFDQSGDTVIVIADPVTFRIEETNGGPQILALKTQQYTRFDVFCTYCDMHAFVPHIMKVEVVEHIEDGSIYQGLLAV